MKPGDRVVRLGRRARPAAVARPRAAGGAAAGARPRPTHRRLSRRRAPPRTAYGAPHRRDLRSATAGSGTARTSNRDITERLRALRRRRARHRRPAPRGARARHAPPGRRAPARGGVILTAEGHPRPALRGCRCRTRRSAGGFSATAGRLGAHPFVSLGYLDGALAEVRPTSNVQVGAFAGNTDASIGGPAGGTKAGGFLRFAPRATRLPYEVVVSGVRENAGERRQPRVPRPAGPAPHRRAVAVRARGDRPQPRLARGARGHAPSQLTDARALADLAGLAHAVGHLLLRAAAELLGAPSTATCRSRPSTPACLQTFRADIDLARANAAGVWAGRLDPAARGRRPDGLRRARRRSAPRASSPCARASKARCTARSPPSACRPPRAWGATSAAATASTPPTPSTATTCAGRRGSRPSQWLRALRLRAPERRGPTAAPTSSTGSGTTSSALRAFLEAGYRF